MCKLFLPHIFLLKLISMIFTFNLRLSVDLCTGYLFADYTGQCMKKWKQPEVNGWNISVPSCGNNEDDIVTWQHGNTTKLLKKTLPTIKIITWNNNE